MVKWLINWVASVLTMIPAGFWLGPSNDFYRYVAVLYHFDMLLLVAMSMLAAVFGVSLTFIIQYLLLGETQFKHTTSIMISVLLSASASVLILYKWFAIVSIT